MDSYSLMFCVVRSFLVFSGFGLKPPAIPPIGSNAGLLALSSALGGQSHLPIKDEKKHHDSDHQRGE